MLVTDFALRPSPQHVLLGHGYGSTRTRERILTWRSNATDANALSNTSRAIPSSAGVRIIGGGWRWMDPLTTPSIMRGCTQ